MASTPLKRRQGHALPLFFSFHTMLRHPSLPPTKSLQGFENWAGSETCIHKTHQLKECHKNRKQKKHAYLLSYPAAFSSLTSTAAWLSLYHCLFPCLGKKRNFSGGGGEGVEVGCVFCALVGSLLNYCQCATGLGPCMCMPTVSITDSGVPLPILLGWTHVYAHGVCAFLCPCLVLCVFLCAIFIHAVKFAPLPCVLDCCCCGDRHHPCSPCLPRWTCTETFYLPALLPLCGLSFF